MTNREFYQKPRQGLLKLNEKLRFLYLMSLTIFVCSFLSFQAFSQGRTISGKILSSKDNAPLPGVNIVIKGTNQGAVTDANGQFTLAADDNAVLVISQIGMETQEVTIGSRSTIDVSLVESTAVLEEVVVTALGISQEKRGLGYATQTVSGQEIIQTQRPNFINSLQGRVAGLAVTTTSGVPGASTSLTLRGVGSITGSNQPLIVVDGLPIDNTVFNQHTLVSDNDNRNNDYINRAADINPNDIESITVLKGPEAAALYGQGGASGAIIITTKRGTPGKVKITYDNNFGFQKLYRFPEIQKVYGRGDFGYNSPTVEEIYFFGPKYADGTKFYDNTDNFFKTGTTQTHNFVVEGGSDAITNRFAVNYYTADGVVPESKYDKFSARLTSSSKFANKLDVTTTLNYVWSKTNKPTRGTHGFLMGVMTWPTDDYMEAYLDDFGRRRRLMPDVYSTAGTNVFYPEPNNPYFNVLKNKNTDETNRVIGNISMSYDATKWLNVTGRLAADIYATQGNYFTHPEGIFVSAAVPNLNVWGINQGTNVTGGPIPGGAIENYDENSRLLNGMLLATFKKDIGKFKSSLMLGTSFDDKYYDVNSTFGRNLQLKDFNSMNNTDPATRNAKTTITRQRLVSVLGNLNVSYDDLVYLTVTGRNDWSSTLPIESNSFFYPSFALSFVFTELDVLENNDILSFGKLRASYAEVGKSASPYKTKPQLAGATTTGGGFSYGVFGAAASLVPERAEGYEIGTELKFFNGRAGLDLAVYRNDRTNQISSQRLSYGTGFVIALLNGGDISVRGVEIQLSGSPIKTTDFEWNVLFNFSKSKSKVLELPADVREYYNSDTWMYANARGSAFPSDLQSYYPAASYPYYNWNYLQRGLGSGTGIGGFTYERNSNGDILINPSNGLPIKTADFLPIGDRNPDFMIGLTNSFTYKNFSLSFLLDIRKGGDIFNGNEMFLFNRGLSTRSLNREQPYVFEGVLKDGLENSATPTKNTVQVIPYTLGSSFYGNGTSTWGAFAESDYVERDINWLRLRDVTISYTLPSKALGVTKVIKSASVFVTATDLFLITNYTGADPSVNGTTAATAGSGAFGFDFGSLSAPRTISTGIRIGL